MIGARRHLGKVFCMIRPGSSCQCGHIAHHQGTDFLQVSKDTVLGRKLTSGIRIRVDQFPVFVIGVHFKIHIVRINDPVLTNILMDLALRIIQIFLKVCQIVFFDTGINRCVQFQILIVGINHIFFSFRFLCRCIFPNVLRIWSHQSRHIKTG